jgi:hypothetical protein
MDDYSKIGPKTSRAHALAREAEVRRQMRELLALDDERLLKEALVRDHEIGEKDPRFSAILRTWRELRQHRS